MPFLTVDGRSPSAIMLVVLGVTALGVVLRSLRGRSQSVPFFAFSKPNMLPAPILMPEPPGGPFEQPWVNPSIPATSQMWILPHDSMGPRAGGFYRPIRRTPKVQSRTLEIASHADSGASCAGWGGAASRPTGRALERD